MRVGYLALPAALLMSSGAIGQTQETQFAVRATVVADCQVVAVDLNFGTYDPAAAKTGQTVVTLRCTPGSAATVAFDGGSSGNPQARRMVGPANLTYQLYRDAALADPINTTDAAFELGAAENTGVPVPYTVYGQIPANQSVPAGDYVDTIRVTVEF